MSEVTQLLQAISAGNCEATSQLLPLIYQELRAMARAQMVQERKGHTLQATALVHEAYMQLVGDDARWDGRAHFFGAAAEAMRRILIQHARRKNALKRGGGARRVEFDDDDLPISAPCHEIEDLLALDEALDLFTEQHPEKAEVVKLLYFAGLNLDEAASALGIARTTVYRHWVFARAWLFEVMAEKSEKA